MVICCVVVCVQCWSEIVNVTVFVPDELYIIPVGFCAIEVAGAAPSPKFHEYAQLFPALPIFVKFIATVEHCGALEVNVAVGV